jgi:SH3-like domain-containing protein
MAARSLILAAVLSVFAAVPLAAPVLAQELIQPEVPNSRFQFAGVVNAASVHVRSGPGENYYPAMRLDRSAPVTVVGIKFDWLKIVPPEGAFSVVAKHLVEREGESGIGRIAADNVNIRAGSLLVPLKVTVQCRLKRGDTVTIIGQEDDYFRIRPPAEAYLYIHQRFVDPVKQIALSPDAGNRDGTAAPADADVPAAEDADLAAAGFAAAPTTRPAGPDPLAERARGEAEFDRLEAAARAGLALPLAEQPLAALMADYEKMLENTFLPASMRQLADIRMASFRVRLGAQTELLASRRQQEDGAARLAAIQAQREVIEARLGAIGDAYLAVGALAASSLQLGTTTLYRITDPGTGRTMCYLRSNDAAYVELLGRIVGVKGDLAADPQLSLRVIHPTSAAEVNPANINRTFTAQIIPPSMLVIRPQTASTDNN